jgi:predicted nucleic acid-binding protein
MKCPLVFDATPLIYLGKARLLEKLSCLGEEKIIPQRVYDEVVSVGKRKEKSDALYVERLIDQNIFTIKKTSKCLTSLKKNTLLSASDKDVLVCAKECNGIVIADDEEVRKITSAEGIEHHGTIYILFRLVHKKVISKKEVKSALDVMINKGWYCSVDLYNYVMGELEK